mgnify:FL=1
MTVSFLQCFILNYIFIDMIKLKELLNEIEEACWDSYKQVGMKLKGGREVPNCVKKEGLEDTSWEDNGKKITLQQLLDVIKHYPVVQAPIEKVKKISLTLRSGGIEPDRVTNANIKYPIIIVVDDSGNYKSILDGNHRANKAIQNGSETIPAKLVNIKKLPPEFQDVLDEDLEDDDNIEEYDVESEQDVKEFVQFMREYKQPLCEAEYRGRKVSLGKRMQGDVKKFKVYVKNPKGKVVKVNFGFGGSSAKGKRMTIKKNNPARRKNFRARHNCDNPGPRTKARYWSCRAW